MRFLRIVAFVLIFFGCALMGRDGLASLSEGSLNLLPVGQLWFHLSPGSLNALQAGAERYVSVGLWDNVLAPILQVPAFHEGLTTLETHSAEERVETFGDDGIYRCYTNDDYEARLRAAGFAVEAFRADEVADNLVQRYQLKREVLHLCRKRDGGRA